MLLVICSVEFSIFKQYSKPVHLLMLLVFRPMPIVEESFTVSSIRKQVYLRSLLEKLIMNRVAKTYTEHWKS